MQLISGCVFYWRVKNPLCSFGTALSGRPHRLASLAERYLVAHFCSMLFCAFAISLAGAAVQPVSDMQRVQVNARVQIGPQHVHCFRCCARVARLRVGRMPLNHAFRRPGDGVLPLLTGAFARPRVLATLACLCGFAGSRTTRHQLLVISRFAAAGAGIFPLFCYALPQHNRLVLLVLASLPPRWIGWAVIVVVSCHHQF